VTDRHPVSPVGLHRVLEPQGVLPQAAWKLDPNPALVDGEVRVRQVMQLTLSFDHRLVDGALGSQVLASVARFLEDPAVALVLG